METGTVKRFNPDNHYGFIAPDSGGDDVHLHERALRDQRDVSRLSRGVRVSYEVRRSERGLRAVDVRLLDAGQPGSDEADVLSEGEFREAVYSLLNDSMAQFKDGLVALARKHGWVE